MLNIATKKALFGELFALLDRADALLLAARAKHEAELARRKMASRKQAA
jgi:hypothetical protein